MANYLAPAVIGGRAYLAPVAPPQGGATTPVRFDFPASYEILSSTFDAPSDITDVTISPVAVTMKGGTGQVFTAVVTGQNNPNTAVTWSASLGVVSQAGSYNAPVATTSDQTILVRATSVQDPSKWAEATITVLALPTVISVSVGPVGIELAGGATYVYTANVTGTNEPSQEVTWTTTFGEVNSIGRLTVPTVTLQDQTGTITATSVLDPTKSGSVTFKVLAGVISVPDPIIPPVVGDYTSIADRVKDTSNTTGTGSFVMNNTPGPDFQRLLTAPIIIGSIVPYSAKHLTIPGQWENGRGKVLDANTLERVIVTSSSSNGQKVYFAEGGVEISVTLTADYLGQLTQLAGSLVPTTTLGDPTTTKIILDKGGVANAISVDDASIGFPELPVLPLPAVGTDEIHVSRGGVDYRVTLTAIAAAVALIVGLSSGTADTTAPTVVAATIANATPNQINLSFSEPLVGPLPPPSVFTLNAGRSASSFSGSGMDFVITLSSPVTVGESVTLSYAQPATSPLQDGAATPNRVVSFTGRTVTNNVALVSATGVTLSGPTGGAAAVQSTDFSVGVTPVGSNINGTVTVTPSDGGAGGSFSPTSVPLTNAARTGMFKYTPPATAGTRTISVSNNGALTNPAAIGYTSTSNASPLAITTPTVQQAGVDFTLAGTYIGTAPPALDYSTDGVTWYQPAVAATIGNNAWSMTVYVNAANANQIIRVRNRTTLETIASNAFNVTAAKTYTVTGYNGNTVKSTYDATAVANSGSNKALTEAMLCTGSYWNIQAVPTSAYVGWGESAVTPPPLVTTAQNITGGLNGMAFAAKTGANVFPLPGNCFVPSTPGTYQRSLWVRPNDGAAVCVGTVTVTVA